MAIHHQKLDYADVLTAAGVTTLRVEDVIVKPKGRRMIDVGDGDDIDVLAPALRAIDHANEIIRAAPAGVDYSALIAALLPMLIAFVQAQINKPPAPAPTPTPTPVPTPTKARKITSFRLKYHQIVRENKTVGVALFKQILARDEPVINKDRVVADCSPLDQFGVEIRDGEWTPELEAAMFFPDGTQRLRWYGHNDEISRITMSHPLGLMPRIKVDADLPNDEDLELGELFGLYYATGPAPEADDNDPDFSRGAIQTPTLPSLRVRR